jgi:predicted dehydrogenase
MKRIGIVGAGMMASWHAKRCQNLPVTLAGVFDSNHSRAQTLADTFEIQAFDNLEACLDACDVVDVCTPTDQHAEVVLAAAAAGKDVICEKPMARTLQDAETMVNACQDAGVRLFIAQVVRFFPQYAQAKATLQAGDLGTPGVIRLNRGGSFPGRWYGDYARSGGVVLDLAIHDLDMARWCFGEADTVMARGLTFENISERDFVSLTLTFASGALGHVSGSWAYPAGKFVTSLEIAGSEGILEWSSLSPDPVQGSLDSSSDLTSVVNDLANPLAAADDPYFRELEHALGCLETNTPFLIEPADALATLKLALAANASLKQGQPIHVPSFAPTEREVLA